MTEPVKEDQVVRLLKGIRRLLYWVGAIVFVLAVVTLVLELQVTARNADIHKVKVSAVKLETAVNKAVSASRDAKKVVDAAVATPTPPAVSEAFRQVAVTNSNLLKLCEQAGADCQR